ncbi:Glucose-repressible alcohol dehydrogenase transcriptional effector [Phlyctochytrium planicorne]|nr:Glucose-repressible alcohol dehydrogenase transcriptional effector [Phlyctochytrium planicorne]
MGIHGLMKVISDNAPDAIKELSFNACFGRKVAIDASMALYQFLIAIRRDGEQLTNETGEVTSHLKGLMDRTIRMVENGMKPVYVFDGKPPEMKSGELKKRLEKREDAEKQVVAAVESGDVETFDKFSKRTVKVTKEQNKECQRLLKLMGIPFVEAPCEAEAQCAALAKAGKVYAAGSEDMDTLTFGSAVLFRHLTFSESRKMPVNEIVLEKVLQGLGLTMEQFIDMCILLGCDYCDSIKGVGPIKALNLIKEHKSIENILKVLDSKKYTVPEDWAYKEARELFLKPEVHDPETVDLVWQDADEEGIVEFLVGEKNFNEERVRASVKKLSKAKTGTVQGRLADYFKPLPKEQNAKVPDKRKLQIYGAKQSLHNIAAQNSYQTATANGHTGGHHQKQVDQAQLSRQSASPHHHARVAAAAARTANGMGMTEPVGTSNLSLVNPSEKPSEWTIIDLGGMQIKNLSLELFRYTFLTTLYLNHNNLTFLSPEVSKLASLVVLDLSGNRLTSIPPDLGLVVSLRELLLFDNQLTFLPPELGSLFQLETLGLEGNPISEPLLSLIQKEGTAAVITYLRENIPAGTSPQEREWIPLEEDSGATGDVFTVMCYNTLCDKYATAQAYAYTPSWVLNWEYRRELLLHDILNYSADIVCLQEVEMGQFEDYFQMQLGPLGEYEGVFWPKSRARTMGDYEKRSVDGCATFFKTSKFVLKEKHTIEFQQLAMQKPELRKTEDVFNRVMVKDNIAIVTLLESKETQAKILVANTHLHWDVAYKDVKLVQTAILMEELQRLSTLYSTGKTPLPVILCGDFNSLPNSGVYEFLSRGSVSQDHDDFGTYTYGNYTSEGLAHNLSLKSAYSHVDELDFTNFTATFKGVIDYIWYTTPTLSITGLLSNVEKGYVAKNVGFPNAHHPSDHIPLVVSCRWKGAINKTKVKF